MALFALFTELQKFPSASPSPRPLMCGGSAASWPSSTWLITFSLPIVTTKWYNIQTGQGRMTTITFQCESFHPQMKCIVEVLGQPEDRLLNAGKNTQQFFQKDEGENGPTWQMMVKSPWCSALIQNLLCDNHKYCVPIDEGAI